MPFTLDLGVTGDVAGEPTYTEQPEDVDSPAPTSDPQEPAGSDDTDQAAAAATDGGGPSAGFVVGGLGLVALLAAGYLVLRSRTA